MDLTEGGGERERREGQGREGGREGGREERDIHGVKRRGEGRDSIASWS